MEIQRDKTKATFWICLKQFFKAYDFSLQVILAVGLGCAIFLLDYYDIPSQIIINTPGGVLWPIIYALAVLLVVWLLDLHVFDLFVITSENALDAAATVTILASIFYVYARMVVLGKCIYTQIAVCLAVTSLLIIKNGEFAGKMMLCMVEQYKFQEMLYCAARCHIAFN